MNYTKEQLEKLPKWAQQEIRRFEIYVKSLEDRIGQFSGKLETNTYLRDGLDRMPLQNNAQIEFKTGENQFNNVSVYVRHDGVVDVNTDSRMGHTMVVIPRAANAFYIKFVDFNK